MPDSAFARRVLRWQSRYGRKDLPWQQDKNAYKVWISEIMLQQTRVETVMAYFTRFLTRFPTLDALASAPLDEVLHLWSGLGYYARARNLHRAARILVERHDGEFPADLDALADLPGIGRSTAGAILSLGMDMRATILDGNVRRLLARHSGIEGWTGNSQVQRVLWEIAERHTPTRAAARYNQAMMDLGATVCTPTGPRCEACPIATDCVARATQRTHLIPAPRPRRALPVREVRVAVIRNARGEVLLQRRAPQGVWGGLWSFPELDADSVAQIAQACATSEDTLLRAPAGSIVRHTFTHFHLDITPVHVQLATEGFAIHEPERWRWYDPDRPAAIGLAAPVARMIADLQGS